MSSSGSQNNKTYAPSIASTSTAYSYSKPLIPEPSLKPKTSLRSKAKKLLSDIGSSPTAEFDRQALENGEIMTDAQKAFAKMDFPATLASEMKTNNMKTH